MQPDAPSLQRAIQAELRQPAYAWHAERAWQIPTWLDRALRWLGHAIGRFLRWLFGWLFPDRRLAPTHAGPGLHLAVWLIVVVCLALIAILLSVIRRRRRAAAATPAVAAPRLDVATANAAERDPDAWLRLALELRERGEPRLALRAAFLAGLARRQLLHLRRDRTNREYCRELARRAPLLPAAGGRAMPESTLVRDFRASVCLFDEAWYGSRAVAPETLDHFLDLQRGLVADA